MNTHYKKKTHKFGTDLPKTVKEVLELDKKNGNTLWWDAIQKEMLVVKTAFKILHGDEKPLLSSQFMLRHMVFDVKMEAFQQKTGLVAGGHMTEQPKTLTYDE